MMFQNIYLMYHYIKNKEERGSDVIITIISEHEESKNQTNNLMNHGLTLKKIKLFWRRWTYLMASVIFNREPPSYVTMVKLVFIPMEFGTRSYLLTSYLKENYYGRCKLDIKHHSGAHYLSLPELMGNDSCHPSFCTRPRSAPMISTIIYHWNI